MLSPLQIHTLGTVLMLVMYYGSTYFIGNDNIVTQTRAVVASSLIMLAIILYYYGDKLVSNTEYFMKAGTNCPEGTHEMPSDPTGKYKDLGSNENEYWCMPNDAEH